MFDAKTLKEIHRTAISFGHSKQLRARATREQLVDAARIVFARDGFEMARLEDIATAAGKTRGAFYAHFRDKDDVFLAIFEENMMRDQERMRVPLSVASSREQTIEVLVQHLFTLLSDRRRMLLNLEFKAYVIRHPHKQKRLVNLLAAMCLCCAETSIDRLLPELRHADTATKRAQSARFGALIDGLAINHLYDPACLTAPVLLSHLRSGVESILAQPPVSNPIEATT